MGLLDRWAKKTEKEQLQQAVAVEPTKKSAPAKAAVASTLSKTTKKSEVVESVVKQSLIADKILVRPLITEKSAVAQGLNKYSFIVRRDSTKGQIKKAILEVYGVNPKSVNMINVSGRWVRFGRSFGRRSDYKKAVVTLPAGKSIAVHEGV